MYVFEQFIAIYIMKILLIIIYKRNLYKSILELELLLIFF